MINDKIINEVSDIIEESVTLIQEELDKPLSNMDIMWLCMETIAKSSTPKDYKDKEELVHFTAVMIESALETVDYYLIPEDHIKKHMKRSESWEGLMHSV